MKVEDAAGLVIVERPEFIAEPLKLFLMGLGYRFSSFDLLPPQEITKKIDEETESDHKKERIDTSNTNTSTPSQTE